MQIRTVVYLLVWFDFSGNKMASRILTLLFTAFACVLVLSNEMPKPLIRGPSTFAITGKENLTLTCEVPGIVGPLDFVWTGVCASHTNTCTLQPKPEQNGCNAVCTATNSNTSVATAGNYSLNLTFPPQSCNFTNNDTKLTKAGLNISLLANPVPNDSTVFTSHDKHFAQSSAELDKLFDVMCISVNITHALCELRQGNISTAHSSSYYLTLSNDLGNCTVSFVVGSKESLPTDEKERHWIIAAVLVPLALLAAVIFAVYCFMREDWNYCNICRMYFRGHCRETSERNEAPPFHSF